MERQNTAGREERGEGRKEKQGRKDTKKGGEGGRKTNN